MQTEHITFRASPVLATALYSRARDAGCSVSEYLRSIVRVEVGRTGQEAPAPDECAAVLTVHEMAARGDASAYFQLADWHYQRGLRGDEPAVIAFARASDCARLGAMARGERGDWINFLFLLNCHANALRAAGYGRLADTALGESVALAEFMADDGDQEIADMVVGCADQLTPESMNIARALREHVKGVVEC